MKIKRMAAALLLSGLILSACDDDSQTEETDTEVVEEDQDVTDEEETQDVEDEDSEDLDEEDATGEEEDESNAAVDGDLPSQQPGDVLEAEGGTRTIVSTSYGIDDSMESGPFELALRNAQISFMEAAGEEFADLLGGEELVMVSLQMDVTNNSEETNTIYPDQGTIVTNTGEQVDAHIWLSDSVGGEFFGEVTKSGDVFFFYPGTMGDAEAVESIRYIVGSGHDEDFENLGEDIEMSVDF